MGWVGTKSPFISALVPEMGWLLSEQFPDQGGDPGR